MLSLGCAARRSATPSIGRWRSGNGPAAVQACLAAVNGQLAAGDEASWAATRAAMEAIAGSEDMAEGMRAFLERRPPVWQGR
jgi:enoyl-CoA hydratase